MHLLDTTLGTLVENLALDEALLLEAENGGPEVLRLWQWPVSAVVLGAGCKLNDDVNVPRCDADQVPILRRASGGGTVLLGPGCLLFSLILAYDTHPSLKEVRTSYAWILERIAAGLTSLGFTLSAEGTSDLTLGQRKVSGNAQQRKRGHLLHHGTLLYDFDAAQAEHYLHQPGRQPDYRRQRGHGDFLGNLPTSADELRRMLCQAWNATTRLHEIPSDRVSRLVAEKYGVEAWIRRR